MAWRGASKYDVLRRLLAQQPEVPECQRLHFLQMACEKLVKAHLFAMGGHNPDLLRKTHAVIRKHLKRIVAHTLNRLEPDGRRDRHRTLIQFSNRLASEIEWLSPTCDDDGRRPSNTEYPWEENGELRIPMSYHFTLADQRQAPGFRSIAKLIHEAIQDLVR